MASPLLLRVSGGRVYVNFRVCDVNNHEEANCCPYQLFVVVFKEPLSWIFENDCSCGVEYIYGNENILQRFISESAPYIKLLSFKSDSQL